MNLKLKIALLVLLAVGIVVLGFILSSPPVEHGEDVVEIGATATPQVIVIDIVPTPTPLPAPTVPPDWNTPVATETPVEPTPDATPVQSGTEYISGSCFTLGIAGSKVAVAKGVDESTLVDGPGWLETSAKPGQEGMCVVYGHRNRNHLKVLKNVKYGDTITVNCSDGTTFTYIVESVEIVGSDAELRVPTQDGANIMLTTCYPFYYSGHAPEKYVVIGRLA